MVILQKRFSLAMTYKHIKRITDIAGSLTALSFLSPPLFVMFLYMLLFERPVFFIQERVGLNGRKFDLIKFRSMEINNSKTEGEVYSDSPEVTSIGRILRRFKIDEIPQLYNVLIGDMSLIGPRPLPKNPSEFYDKYKVERDSIRPGLTGLAQVNGNIYISKNERFKLDFEYIEKVSFKLDIQIIMKTILVVLLGEKKFI